MAFFSIQLARIDAHNIRSRTTDIDLLTFGVVVAGRDQGHGSALVPVWPGTTLAANEFNQAADVNGFPHAATHMSKDWVIGPLEIADTDEVSIVYAATNTSDSQIPTADQEKINAWEIRMLDLYYSALVGEFISELGLATVVEFIGGHAGEAIAAFFTDPVGKLLGYEAPGPCNGTVFVGKRTFTGASLSAATVTPGHERPWGHDVDTRWCELTENLTDAASHNRDHCGELASTDVTLRITRYESWSLRTWSGVTLEPGLRRMLYPNGGALKTLTGLRA